MWRERPGEVELAATYQRVRGTRTIGGEGHDIVGAVHRGRKGDTGPVDRPQWTDIVATTGEALETLALQVEHPDVANANMRPDAHRDPAAVRGDARDVVRSRRIIQHLRVAIASNLDKMRHRGRAP